MAWGFGDPAEEQERDAPGLWGTQAERVPAGGMDPVTMTALISAGSSVLGKALAPSASSAGPSQSGMTAYSSFDNSGWSVAFGGDASAPNAVAGAAAATASGGMSSWLIGAAILSTFVVAVLWVKKH